MYIAMPLGHGPIVVLAASDSWFLPHFVDLWGLPTGIASLLSLQPGKAFQFRKVLTATAKMS